MKKFSVFSLAVTVLAVLGATAAQANAKVQVCHIPPGNPANFHTIKISENALSAHLAHGDLGGPCDAACATLCDDQNECTADSCAAASGCVNTPRLGEDCDDGQVCSGPDTCNAQWACQGPAIDNCCLDDSACIQNPCDQASCNLDTNRRGEDPVICNPPDLCTASECAPDTGECVDTAIVCDEGETCNEATGECEEAEVTCPCEGMSAGTSAYTITWDDTLVVSQCDSGLYDAEGHFYYRAGDLVGFSAYIQVVDAPDGDARGVACIIDGPSGPLELLIQTTDAELEACIVSLKALAAADGVTCPDPF